MEFTIHSIGDSAFLEQVLNALAMLTSTSTDTFNAILKIGMLIGVLSTVLTSLINGAKGFDFQHFILSYLLISIMFIPKATVLIEDSYTGEVRVVDNVPMGPAAAGGIITAVGYGITKLFEVAYNPIIPKMTSSGFLESLKILTDIRENGSSSNLWQAMNSDLGGGFVDLKRSWTNYIMLCTMKKMDFHLMTPEQLRTLPVYEALQTSSTAFHVNLYLDPGNPNGQDYSCTEAWPELTARMNNGPNTLAALNALLLDKTSVDPNSAVSKTNDALGALAGITSGAQAYVRNAVLEPVVLEAAKAKYDMSQYTAGALMINEAISQRNTQWAAEQTMFMSVERPMMAFFEAFIYGIAPIMAFVITLGPTGIKLAGKYFMLLIWIQLWMPILSVVNLYIYVEATSKLGALAAQDAGTYTFDSFYALNATSDILQNWIAVGGLLAASTPGIALMLIYGSSVTATALAGRLNSSGHIDQKKVSPDVASVGPLLNEQAWANHSRPQGTRDSEQVFSTMDIANSYSQSSASALQKQHATAQSLTSALGNSVASSSNDSELNSRAHALSDTLRASGGQANTYVDQASESIRKALGLDESHADGIRSMTATAFAMDAGKPNADDGTIMSLLKRFKSSIGMSSSTSDDQRQSISNAWDNLKSNMSSLQGNAAFEQALAHAWTESNQSSQSRVWSNSDVESTARDYKDATSTAESFQQSSSVQQLLNLSSSKGVNVIANDALNHENQGGLGAKIAHTAAENIKQQEPKGENGAPGVFSQNWTNAYQMFMRQTHGNEPQASTMASLYTLSRMSSYADPTGDLAQYGTKKSLEALAVSQGMKAPANLGIDKAFANKSVDVAPLHTNKPAANEGLHNVDHRPVQTDRIKPAGTGLSEQDYIDTKSFFNGQSWDAGQNAASQRQANAQAEGIPAAEQYLQNRQNGAQTISIAALTSGAKGAMIEYGRSLFTGENGGSAGSSLIPAIQEARSAFSGAILSNAQSSQMSPTQAIDQGTNDAYKTRLDEAVHKHHLRTDTGAAQIYAMGFSMSVHDEAARLIGANFGGVTPEAANGNHLNSQLNEAMNLRKLSFVPGDIKTDSEGYQVGANGQRQLNDGSPIRHFHYEDSPAGKKVVLENQTLDKYAEESANNLFTASFVGSKWATQQMIELQKVDNTLKPTH